MNHSFHFHVHSLILRWVPAQSFSSSVKYLVSLRISCLLLYLFMANVGIFLSTTHSPWCHGQNHCWAQSYFLLPALHATVSASLQHYFSALNGNLNFALFLVIRKCIELSDNPLIERHRFWVRIFQFTSTFERELAAMATGCRRTNGDGCS